jgi:phosphotransferase system enzyme I (PtsI)
MSHTNTEEIRITGISGSNGICIGKAYLVDKEGVDVLEKYYIREEKINDEVNRFKSAVKNAKDELGAIIEDIPEELRKQVHILEAHMVLFKDKMLYGKTIETIEGDMVNAEWALKKVVSSVKFMFQSIADPYLKGRATDIVHVSDRIMRNLVGVEATSIAEIDKRVILVAQDLSPADTSQIKLEKVKGFVTDRGGKTSHTGIMAKTLGIPSVLGLDTATSLIDTDDIIIVDGKAGVVIVHPTDETIIHYDDLKTRDQERDAVIISSSRSPAETTDGLQFKIMGNIERPQEVAPVLDYGGDGIGLFRTEFLYLTRGSFPKEEELFQQYKEVVELMGQMPVSIRTLDVNGDKAIAHASDPDEENPALGLRAIRFCLKKKDVFTTQLRAILRAAAFGNIRIIFPMISGIDEVLEAKRFFQEAAEALDREGVPFNSDIKIGIMMEVPSAVIMADKLAELVDFFSIGTNDLVQYSLAIDRGNREVAYLYQPLHPALMRMVKSVIDVGRDTDTDVCMCGEMAGDPMNTPILLGMGMKELSMNPYAIPSVKKMIRTLNINESRQFAKDVLKQSKASDIVKMVQDTYGNGNGNGV